MSLFLGVHDCRVNFSWTTITFSTSLEEIIRVNEHKYVPVNTIVGDIEDDGTGFNVDKRLDRGEGMGLLGMRERVELIKGKLEIESKPGKGTRVHFEIPRQESGG